MQNDVTQQIIAKLKTFKQQGLTFYQASEELKRQGYTPVQIADATGQFSYTGTMAEVNEQMAAVPSAPPRLQNGSEMDRNYQKLGNALLADKERSRRPYVYLGLVIPAGGFAQGMYRLWLTKQYWASHGNPRYLLANNLGRVCAVGVIGAVLMAAGLKLYFLSRDKRYAEIDGDLRNGSGSQQG